MAINLNDYGWEKVEAKTHGEYYHVPPVAYVCKIIDARLENVKDKGLMLALDVDIAEGDYAGYFARFKRGENWDFNAQFKRYVMKTDRKITSTFKGLIKSLEKQNASFSCDVDNFDEKSLIGLTCGFTFAEREYFGRDGRIYSAPTIKFPCNADDVRAGKVEVPPADKVSEEKKTAQLSKEFEGAKVDDDDLPF